MAKEGRRENGKVKCLFCGEVVDESNARFVRGSFQGKRFRKYDCFVCYNCIDELLTNTVEEGHYSGGISADFDYDNYIY